MTSTIQHRRSTTAGAVPASLLAGELAVNETDANLFYKAADGSVGLRFLAPEPGIQSYVGEANAAATVDLDITQANIGLFKGFLLRVYDYQPASNQDLKLRFGSSGGIQSGSSSYIYTIGRTDDYIDISSGDNSLYLTDNNGPIASSSSFVEALISGNEATSSGNSTYRSYLFRGMQKANSPSHTGEVSAYWGMGRYIGGQLTLTTLRLLAATGNITKMRYQLVGYP